LHGMKGNKWSLPVDFVGPQCSWMVAASIYDGWLKKINKLLFI
jgi:hypothetical protein